MCSFWFHHGTVKSTNDYIYKHVIVINDNVYIIGSSIDNESQGAICKLDLQNLNVTEHMSMESTRFPPYGKYSKIFAYEDQIVYLLPIYRSTHCELIKINTITKQINNININLNFNYHSYWNFIDQCVIMDHLYIIWLDRSEDVLSILSINLNTLEITGPFSNISRRRIQDYPNLTAVPIGSEIYCLLKMQTFMFVFNTENNEWREIYNFLNESYITDTIYQTIIINNEIMAFKRETNRKFIEIFSFQTMKWRIPNYSVYPEDFVVFTNYFAFQGKIFTIRNSSNARKLYSEESVNPETVNEMEIYVLDLNPSLEALSAARILQLNLDQSKLPKKLQDQLKRYKNL
ncbi:hypothetical protein CHUAL_008954 [Chamberlinius hualienensis]